MANDNEIVRCVVCQRQIGRKVGGEFRKANAYGAGRVCSEHVDVTTEQEG